MSEITGIFQGDIILRTALMAALEDMRANSWLLDHVFASLKYDALTSKTYGQKEIDRAKAWFLKTKIPVEMVPLLDRAKAPMISIKTMSSSEVEPTLGDVHYEPTEATYDHGWPALTPTFTPAYNTSTGWADASLDLVVVPGMLLVEASGQTHEILDVSDTGFQIAPGTVARLSDSVIKSAQPPYDLTLESLLYREVYQIGVHTSGEPVFLTWLHAIVMFAILRYKQALLEARGFERVTFSNAEFDRDPIFEGELACARFLSLSGFSRQVWPKALSHRLSSVVVRVQSAQTSHTEPGIDARIQSWTGYLDP